ncbi:unnamed protein product [Cylicostephanus goldi]|uniref:SCP domain-containing protein n=1 Tax=Cylicostephanus goldi TaxID=71465 RepID=A0A3P6SLJ8_CYLGO|nr:unnamed protein product [Cylicostephanus goldi]
MTPEHRDFILYNHNRLRSKLARGRQQNKEGLGFMPPGKNIYLLKWDCELEKMARIWAHDCPSVTTPYEKTRNIPLGLQLVKRIRVSIRGDNVTKHIDDAMRLWWLEYKRNGNIDSKNRYSNQQKYFGWANMAKGMTTRIGCSYTLCDSFRAIFTCVYNTKVNIENRIIYEPGPACKRDEDCTTFPESRCIASLGLCQAPEIPKGERKVLQRFQKGKGLEF